MISHLVVLNTLNLPQKIVWDWESAIIIFRGILKNDNYKKGGVGESFGCSETVSNIARTEDLAKRQIGGLRRRLAQNRVVHPKVRFFNWIRDFLLGEVCGG